MRVFSLEDPVAHQQITSTWAAGAGGSFPRIGPAWAAAWSTLQSRQRLQLVETLVHLEVESEDTPDFYTLLKISIPDDLTIQSLDPSAGSEWKQDLKLTQRMGDAWLALRETPLARVPRRLPLRPGTTC